MNIFHSIILGLVEGVTEFLPVSSTGHLILTGRLLGLPQSEFLKTFEIAIQLGAILAVVVMYGRLLFRDFEVSKRVAAAFIPTAILGFILYKVVKKVFLNSHEVVLWSLFLGGIFLIVFECWHKESKEGEEKISEMSYAKAVIIGVVQSLAMVPGVSRSAATIVGGLALGLKRKTIVEFSFLLAVPTMLAAVLLDLVKTAGSFDRIQFLHLGVGLVTSFVVAMASIKFLLKFIQNNNFIGFGVYRIVVAALFWLMAR